MCRLVVAAKFVRMRWIKATATDRLVRFMDMVVEKGESLGGDETRVKKETGKPAMARDADRACCLGLPEHGRDAYATWHGRLARVIRSSLPGRRPPRPGLFLDGKWHRELRVFPL